MPATSEPQRRLMAIAEHHPDQLYARNRGVLKMSHRQLHDYAATKGLGRSGQRHDHTPRDGFAHAGTTREGAHLSQGKRAGDTATTGTREDAQDFDHAGTTREGPHWRDAVVTGTTADKAAGQDPKAFANSGTTREGPTIRSSRAAASQAAHEAGGGVTRPTIRRKSASREHSGGTTEGFKTNMRVRARPGAGHFDVNRGEQQARDVPGDYTAGRRGQDSPTQTLGVKPSPAPTPSPRRISVAQLAKAAQPIHPAARQRAANARALKSFRPRGGKR